MFQLRSARLASGGLAALLGVLLISAGGAIAGQPAGWHMEVSPTPASVTAGQDAGFSITITNTGPSNISQLFLVANDEGNPPSYVGTPSQGTCSDAGSRLLCDFGALNANGTPITLIVAYSTAGATGSGFSMTFELNTTGATYTNAKGSHGTLYSVTGFAPFAIGDAGGAFIVDDVVVANDQRLSGSNHQTTLLESPLSHVPATVKDGAGLAGGQCPSAGRLVGECSLIDVAGGGHYFDSPFKVVITVLGSSLPSAVNTNNLDVIHNYIDEFGDPQTETISARCSTEPPPSSEAPCLVVTTVGKNFQIVIWLHYNGGLHGAY